MRLYSIFKTGFVYAFVFNRLGSSPLILLLLDLAPGAHELRIVPVDNGDCDRRIGRTVEFSV